MCSYRAVRNLWAGIFEVQTFSANIAFPLASVLLSLRILIKVKAKNRCTYAFWAINRYTAYCTPEKACCPPPLIGQRCIVPTSCSKLLLTPFAGYSSWSSLINGFKCTYKWLGQPRFWPLKYGQLCVPDGGTINQVTLPVNISARIDYETLRTQLVSSERRLDPETAQVT